MRNVRAWFLGFLSGSFVVAITCAVGFALGAYSINPSITHGVLAVFAALVLGLVITALLAYIQLCHPLGNKNGE